MKKQIFSIIFIIVLTWVSSEVFAQCAMCKAVTESNIEGETNGVGKGLNAGILYLMAIPYCLLMGLLYLFFKDKIREKIKSLKF